MIPVTYAQIVSGGTIKNQEAPVNSAQKPIKVVVVLPMTGPLKNVGVELTKSLIIMRDLIQVMHKVDSKFKFDVRIKNGACSREIAQKVAREIVAQKDIIFVIGHYCSVGSLAAAPIYNEAGIIQITPFSTNSILTEQGYKTFFRLAGRTDRYGEIAAEWLGELKQIYKLATIYGDDVYGKSLVDNVISGLDLQDQSLIINRDKKITNYYRTPFNLNNYRDNINLLINKLVKNDVKIIYFGGYYSDLLPILSIIKKRQLDIKIVTGSSAQNYDLWRQSRGDAEGVIFTFSRDYSRDISDQELNQALVKVKFNKFKKKYGLEAAIRKYGAKASRNVFDRNKGYRDRIDFIQTYFEKYNKFPDAYMTTLYATFEILQDVMLHEAFNDQFIALSDKSLKETYFRQFGYNIADYMKSKGYDPSEEKIGFSTILGAVNFSLTGEWSNIEYFFYQWINRRQSRPWLSISREKNYVGDNGDFIRLF